MEKSVRVEICAHCSGIDAGEINDKYKIKTSCIGKCLRKQPELKGKVYGFLNGSFTVCDKKEEFLAIIESLEPVDRAVGMNPAVDAFLDGTGQRRAVFEALRSIALECGLTEELKWGQPCYMFENKNILIIGNFKDYTALSFFKGALLKDTEGILVRQTENVQAGRQLRYVDVEEIACKKDVIRSYIHEAVEVEKSGQKVLSEEKRDLPVPEELQSIFDDDADFKAAFEALTPGRRKAYLLYFSKAKQSKTRVSRIEKYRDKILEGKGYDD